MKIVTAQPPTVSIIVVASPILAKTPLMACPLARDGQHCRHEQSRKRAKKKAESEPHGSAVITASRMASCESEPFFCGVLLTLSG
jgi:hypothetical protein